MTAPVECRGLTKRYGHVDALVDLTVRLEAGRAVGFLGPNGAGKTTTLRLLTGLIKPTAGEALLFGVPAGRPEARRRLGFLPADVVFDARLSGRDNLDLIASVRGDDATPDRAAAADALGLSAADLDRRVGGYSDGMRQKLGVVAALQHRPDLVVLDEPANRLDPLVHRAFERLVRDVVAAGRTVLLSSHVLTEVEDVCDDVVMVRRGRLLRTASVAELRATASRLLTVRYRDGTTKTERIPAEHPDLLREELRRDDVVDVLVEPASLDEVFVDLYGGEPG